MFSKIGIFYADGTKYYCIQVRDKCFQDWTTIPNSESTNFTDVLGLFVYYQTQTGQYHLN